MVLLLLLLSVLYIVGNVDEHGIRLQDNLNQLLQM